MSWAQLQNESPLFGGEIIGYLHQLGIRGKVEGLDADHVGLRFGSIADVESLKDELLQVGKVIAKAEVSGRPIYTIELDKPLNLGAWSVPCIELPYPKPQHEYADGFEHIEFVLPSSAATIDEFRTDFRAFFPEVDIEALTKMGEYSESMPFAEGETLMNPSLAFRKAANICIKFHPHSLKDIVLSHI